MGWSWLLACGLFVLAVVYLVQKKDSWWVPGMAALLLSQSLIFLYWPVAKFGTLLNAIIVIRLVLAIGSWRFQALVQHERQQLLTHAHPEKVMVTPDRIRLLPAIVQQWLIRSNMVDKEAIRTVHLKQKGEMRTTPTGKWWPVVAQQHFTVDKPGFIWVADI
jgi:hypothetical protein